MRYNNVHSGECPPVCILLIMLLHLLDIFNEIVNSPQVQPLKQKLKLFTIVFEVIVNCYGMLRMRIII